MRPALNPFSPGSGLRPPALVGREPELATLDDLVERTAAGMTGRGIMLSGLRGVGKTVLLNEMRDRAEKQGWLVAALEARPDEAGAASARKTLSRDITAQARRLGGRANASERVRQALRTVSTFSARIGVTGIDLGVEVRPGRADSGDLEVDLPELAQDLCQALAEERGAFAVFVDEIQDLDPALLRALLVTQHLAGQRGWPFYVIGAGLPVVPSLMAEIRSYAERLFDYRTVARLSEADADAALSDPVSSRGVTFEIAALSLLRDGSGGHPYFIQEYGRAAWDIAAGPVITVEDARQAVGIGLERLDAGFFRSRWNRATRSERRLLVAMAADGAGPSSSSEVARRMDIRTNSLGPYRAALISKGLVYAPDHGLLAYTVPGMEDYVHRHREDLV